MLTHKVYNRCFAVLAYKELFFAEKMSKKKNTKADASVTDAVDKFQQAYGTVVPARIAESAAWFAA